MNSTTLTRWSPESASEAFGASESTIRRRLKAANITPAIDGYYSTTDILQALDSAEKERVRELKARIERWELKLAGLRRSYTRADAAKEGLATLVKIATKIVDNSPLPERDRKDINESLESLLTVVDKVQNRQSLVLNALRKEQVEDEYEQ